MTAENTSFEWGKKTYVMGILNITLDSFSGDGILQDQNPITNALVQSHQFLEDGVDILDLGAESSRPGSIPITSAVELDRILPVLKALRKEFPNTTISVDTYKSDVATQCLENGADWINDIWGFKKDPAMAGVVSRFKAHIILMHNRSQSKAVETSERIGSSYQGARYSNFMDDVKTTLMKSASLALEAGVQKDKIILDPGIGFGKTVEQNLILINELTEIKKLGFPVLIGPSRKSFLGHILDLPVNERVEGTGASVSIGIARGADIVRVHDVKQMVRTVRVVDALIR